MSCWLSYKDHYFDSIDTSTTAKRQELSTLIQSAVDFVERYCNRAFLSQEHDRIFTAERNGSIFLYSSPVTDIKRLCYEVQFFTIQNTTAQVATYRVTDTALKLYSITSGVAADTSLTLANYTTVTALVAAVEALSGWTATASASYASYPAIDLMAYQFGNATTAQSVSGWKDFGGWSHWNKEGQVDGLNSNELIRVVYTAGYSDVPEPIKEATAHLAIDGFEGGKIKSESLGGYSYTMEDVGNLPKNDQAILGYYRDRRY